MHQNFTTFTDQMKRRVEVKFPPQRIISLVPSQTELLHYLGLGDRVVGITKFCVHPDDWFRNKKRIGGTKVLKMDAINALQPDLIIGNKEENVKEQIESLGEKYPVWMSDIKTIEDALQMILEVGKLTNTSAKAEKLVLQLQTNFLDLEVFMKDKQQLKVAYFIWKKPYMAAANDTFIHKMLLKAGFINVFERKQRYPETNLEELSQLQPQLILLSSEPYPFKERDFEDFLKVCPNAVIKLVDGELFSWYGNRLLYACEYFKKLHQDIEPI